MQITRREKLCKDFEINSLEEYHDLYDQSNTFLLADAFENFQNMCLEIYKLDLVRLLLDKIRNLIFLLISICY